MKDKTLKEIAQEKRIQQAFLHNFEGTPEEKSKPVQFVLNKLKGFIMDQVEGYEISQAKLEAEKSYQLNKQDIQI